MSAYELNAIHSEADKLALAILTRRRRKCIADDYHDDDCQRCGTK